MPLTITAVRHGESEANVAFARAEAEGRAVVLERPDEEWELSPLGRRQASALGRRLARADPPEAVWCSPYLRAVQTWELIAAELPVTPEVRTDRRLRDREMGRLAGMNLAAIRRLHPREAEVLQRREYDHRPPEGESFADVAARVGEALRDMRARCAGRRVLVVAHDAVVLMLRHVLAEAAKAVEHVPIGNTSVSVWRSGELVVFNDVSHLGETPV
ncbi:histidine phosphatase family protein [Planomonospora venezuelensis]|uniref:Broad specificity phosphatase PhoE n=1 Tax=Planomonospora venezuelensis TaxID=1999 RepID=A0A841D7D0_PLAVE|nr:histidine phosphatase family protein [Planomonospora venezuelensis]MBB5964404.1 broad specificity phosphatase PhoE [Planomonospora venezuelensis]GIN02001.1 phosphoglycerate mutase [Planomonospora venezuelensis]